MKLMKFICLVALGITTLCSTTVFAGEDKATADVSLGIMSNHVWRGFEYSKDSISIQPSATVSYKGFSANMSGFNDTNVYVKDATGYGGNQWTETDMTLSYTRTVGMFDLTAGYIYYTYTGVADDTQEVFAKVKLNKILNPTLTVYWDMANYPGWYTTFGVSHNFVINDKAQVVVGAQVGYLVLDDENNYTKLKAGESYSAFHDGLLSVSIPYTVAKNITVTPVINYSFALSSDAENLIKAYSPDALNAKGFGGDSNFVYGGVTLAMAF